MSSLWNGENPPGAHKSIVRCSPNGGNFQDRKGRTMFPTKLKLGWQKAEWNDPSCNGAKMKGYHLYKWRSLDQETHCSFPLINEPPPPTHTQSSAIWSPRWADWTEYFPLSSSTWQISSWEKFHFHKSGLLTSRQGAIVIFITFLSLPPNLVPLHILGLEGLWICPIPLLMFE